MKNIIKFLILSLVIFSCNSSEDVGPDASKTGEFSLEFDTIVGDETLTFDSRNYTNSQGESFNVSEVKYFISNIELTNENGTTYTVPQEDSYFLINAANRSSRFTKVTVPEGSYKSVSFVLGIDSLRSTKPVEERTGVLSFNPESGHDGGSMYWGWNSGYIFLKFEGSSPALPASVNGKFRYHIGGFGGYSAPTINNIKKITVDLSKSGKAEVRNGFRSNVHFFVDIMKVFNGSNKVSIASNPTVMFSAFSVNIAQNFTEMFTHDHTENFVKSEEEL